VRTNIVRTCGLNGASAGAVRGENPAEAFAKGGDSDERRYYLSQVSERYNTCFNHQRPLPKIIAAG